MGAPRLRPLPAGPVVDGPAIAELIGRPVDEVYAATRIAEFPQPMNRWVKRSAGDPVERSPECWRWSRARVLAHIDGSEVAA